ncbi:MAG: RnfABCDGE type electron transport complex subunit B [Neisseriaceae bacterium]|nr:RnfABCDGE type electron transport complex subunit B [Neisseriaceae bacterium]
MKNLWEQIDQLLPQTQCKRCGYADCAEYAKAVVRDKAAIDLCQMGGDVVRYEIAKLLGLISTSPNNEKVSHALAYIDETACIGCTRCIRVCPTDAICGTNKLMHTVISDECTGCGLCQDACPVDCIKLIPVDDDYLPRNRFLSSHESERQAAAEHAKTRYLAKKQRQTVSKQTQKTSNTLPENIQGLLSLAKEKAKNQKQVSIYSKQLTQDIIATQKKQAAFHNAMRQLKYGNEDERNLAISYLSEVKAQSQKE